MKKILSVLVCVLIVVSACSLTTAFAATDKVITKVEVKGVVDAVIGKVPDMNGISVPSGANYTIDNKYWQDVTARTQSFAKFQDGHKYRLNITVKPKSGYKLDPSVALTVNGKDAYGKYKVVFGEQISIVLDYSFLKKIDKIELPAFPTSVPLGQTNNPVWPSAPTIETEKYDVYEYWMCEKRDGGNIFHGEVSGEFTSGAIYFYEYRLSVNNGYEITEDTVITVGSKKIADSIYNYVDERQGSIYKVYNLSDRQAIHTINITAKKPMVGEAVDHKSTIDAKGVTVKEFLWEDSANSKLVKMTELGNQSLSYAKSSGNFKENRYYTAKGHLEAKEGYYFAEDLVIKVNGVKVDLFWALLYGLFETASPLNCVVFDCYVGKPAAKPVSSVETSSAPSSEPTPSSEVESSLPESSEEVSHDTVSDESPADDKTTGQAEPDVEEKKTSPLPIILGVAGGVLLLGGGAAAYFLWIRKK